MRLAHVGRMAEQFCDRVELIDIERAIDRLRDEISTLKNDVSSLKKDMAIVRKDLRVLLARPGVNSFRSGL